MTTLKNERALVADLTAAAICQVAAGDDCWSGPDLRASLSAACPPKGERSGRGTLALDVGR